MRTLSLGLLALAFTLVGCDAAAPSATADAAPSGPDDYFVIGPSPVKVGDCDTFIVEDENGVQASVSDWTVSGSGFLTNETSSSALVLAESGGSYYQVKAYVQGHWYLKTVTVNPNPKNTYEC